MLVPARSRRRRVVALICAALTGGLVAPVAGAQVPARDPRPGLAAQADQRIRQLQAETDRLAAQTRTLLNELRGLELQRQLKREELKKAEAELGGLDAAREAAAARLASLEAQRVAESPGVRERLVEIYKRGRGGYAALLLRADDLGALGRMARGVASVARLDQVRLETHRRTVRAEQEALAELRQRQGAVTAANADAVRARAALDQAVAAHNRRIDQLDRERDLAARYVGELHEAQAALRSHVGGLPAGRPALPIAPFRGTLPWPTPGRIVSPFGPADGRFGASLVRTGIDIGAAEGQPVQAIHGGTIAFAGPFSGFGTLVIVDHGGQALSLYGHLMEVLVAQGAAVERGSVLGRSGRTLGGQAALYFELRIDGRSVDPVKWLAR